MSDVLGSGLILFFAISGVIAWACGIALLFMAAISAPLHYFVGWLDRNEKRWQR